MAQKKLYRNTQDKMITGVCSGLADYFQVDVTIIRLLMIVFALAAASGVVFYIAATVVIPVKPASDIDQTTQS